MTRQSNEAPQMKQLIQAFYNLFSVLVFLLESGLVKLAEVGYPLEQLNLNGLPSSIDEPGIPDRVV